MAIVTLPETNSSLLKTGRAPKENARIPTINFQGLYMLVSGRVYLFLLAIGPSQTDRKGLFCCVFFLFAVDGCAPWCTLSGE